MLKVALTRSYSALSKRTNKVKVQILKDFPQFQLYKGQVTRVSPSLMRNYLHIGNGARYILSESDVDEELLQVSAEKMLKKPVDTSKVIKQVKPKTQAAAVDVTSNTKATISTDENPKKKEEKVLSSGVTLKDVKIPGLDL
ncbi:LAFE_0C02014g1_1 [Lachancea fermentati]|uniref:LAFE_0C02014g1_1 n=1 Tax=Lachancea fermentati TaxID=4955 RepID=A0A1G4M8Y9_LACFM|nr:LAFE_0C02014g1_1 [Lachancea fermentati]